MRLFRYECPRCGERHHIGLWREHEHCTACAQAMVLTPGLFSSRVFQILFLTGAVWLGVSLGNLRWSLGKLPYDMDQFVLDMVSFWLYAWVSRLVYFQFQRVEIKL